MTQAQDITEPGWAADARELNASIDGSLANRLAYAARKEAVNVTWDYNALLGVANAEYAYKIGSVVSIFKSQYNQVTNIPTDTILTVGKVNKFLPASPSANFNVIGKSMTGGRTKIIGTAKIDTGGNITIYLTESPEWLLEIGIMYQTEAQ